MAAIDASKAPITEEYMHTQRIQTCTTIVLTICVLSLLSFSPANAATYSKGNIPGEIIIRLTEPLNPVKTTQGVRFGSEDIDRKLEQYRVTDAVRLSEEFYQATGDWGEVMILRTSESWNPEQAAEDFQRTPGVVWAQPNHVFQTNYQPNDSSLSEQWYLENIQAFEAWDVATGDPSVILGVIDTGIQWDHPDMINIMVINEAEDINGNGILDSLDNNGIDDDGNGYIDDVIGWDFTDAPPFPAWGDFLVRDNDPSDEMGHGTSVAGIVLAEGDNLWGTAGVAYGCRLLGLRAGNSEGFLQEDDVAAAILYSLIMGVRAVNMSFGDELVSPLLREIVQYAYQEGLIMVCSAGNHGSDQIHYPSGYDQTICVGATRLDNTWAYFSNIGTTLDLVAPGVDMYSPLMGNQWGLFYNSGDGTSFSTPVVTGAVGLILSVNPDLDPEQVRNILSDTADDLGSPGWDIFYGHGKVNLLQAVQSAAIGPEVEVRITHPPTDYGFSTSFLPIIGTAAGTAFSSYQLYWGYGRTPLESQNGWIPILPEPQPYQVVNDTLGIFYIPQSPDTIISIRLQVKLTDSTTLADHVRILYDLTPPEISNRIMTPMIDGDHWAGLLEFETDDITSGFVHLRPLGSQQPYGAYSLGYETTHHRILFSQSDFMGEFEYYITVTNRADLTDTSEVYTDLSLTQPAFHRNMFVQHEVGLPPGYFLYKDTDFDGDGLPEVILNKYTNAFFDTLKIYEATTSGFMDVNSNYILVIPQDVGDSDGDGKLELMGRAYGTTYVFEATEPGGFPNNLIMRDTTNVYGASLLDLDPGDGYGEMILRRDRTYIVYRHLGDGELETIDSLTNDTGGDNRLGKPQIEIDDIDGDGMVEALFGDYDGNILIYEHQGSGLFDFTWTDSLPLPDATNWMTIGDFDGDSGNEFIAGCWTYGGGLESEFSAKRWFFVCYDVEGDNNYIPVDTLIFFGAEHPTDYDEGVSSGDLDGDGDEEILLCLYPDFYIIDYNAATGEYEPIWYYPLCESNLALVMDFDLDGAQEFIFNTGTEMVAYGIDPDRPPAPSGVRAVPIDTVAITLSWLSQAGADSYQVDRAIGSGGFTQYYVLNDTVFMDSAVTRDIEYHYAVHTIDTAFPNPVSPLSLEVVGIPNTRPKAFPQADYTSPHFVTVTFNEPMDQSLLYTGHYAIQGIGSPVTAIPFASGSKVLLAFDGVIQEGSYSVEMEDLWDRQGSLIADDHRIATFTVVIDTINLPYLTRATLLGSGGITLEFSAPMNPTSINNAANYRLDPMGEVLAAYHDTPQSVLLKLDKSVPIGAVGRSFTVSAWNLFDSNGNPIDTLHNSAVLQAYSGNLDNVYVYPNPYEGIGPDGEEAVIIAGLTREATVNIMTVNGRLVRTLVENDGDGGVRWDLKNMDGDRVASGIYLYYITNGTQKKRGKFAILR